MGFEHGMESVQEFAHDGDQGLHFEFALSEQMLIRRRPSAGSCWTATKAGMKRA